LVDSLVQQQDLFKYGEMTSFHRLFLLWYLPSGHGTFNGKGRTLVGEGDLLLIELEAMDGLLMKTSYTIQEAKATAQLWIPYAFS